MDNFSIESKSRKTHLMIFVTRDVGPETFENVKLILNLGEAD
jgi:hypothetical protein